MLPKALKSCPKSNKSPNLVTLQATTRFDVYTSDRFYEIVSPFWSVDLENKLHALDNPTANVPKTGRVRAKHVLP